MTSKLQNAIANLVDAVAVALRTRLGLVLVAVVLSGSGAGALEVLLPHAEHECPPCPEVAPGPAAPVEVPVEPAAVPEDGSEPDAAVSPGVAL